MSYSSVNVFICNIFIQCLILPFLLDDICDYFGVKIAIYFAWLGHYTKALTLPAFFGLFMWLCCYGRDQVSTFNIFARIRKVIGF